MNKWVKLTENNPELQWSQWGTFNLDILTRLWDAKRKKSTEFPKSHEIMYFISKQKFLRLNEPKFASLRL